MAIIAIAGILTNVVTGLLQDQINEEVVDKIIKKNLRKWFDEGKKPINHDIERAVREAELNAGLLFLSEYIKQNKDKTGFLSKTPAELKKIKDYLYKEKDKIDNPDFKAQDIPVNFEVEDLINPKRFAGITLQFKQNFIRELEENAPPVPPEFARMILDGIQIDGEPVDWFELTSSFFIETLKTNERVKTAVETGFLTEIKDDLKQKGIVMQLNFNRLSEQISGSHKIIVQKIDRWDDKLDALLEQLSKLGTGNNKLSPEVLRLKENIKQKIDEITEALKQFPEDEKAGDIPREMHESLQEIEFDDIILALKNQTAILFIGPEISVNENGESLHEQFFKSISSPKMTYNAEEGFFLPGAENRIRNKAKDYYQNIFPEKNRKAKALLEKLAQIPFKLIISYAPDDTISRIFDNYDMPYKEYAYEPATELDVDIDETGDVPVIYYAFGNAAKNGKYIYTHKQFNAYLKAEPNKRIPYNIQQKLMEDAVNYIFIGFDFNKWYYRAIIFDLKESGRYDNEQIVVDGHNKTLTMNKDFVHTQFEVNFIQTDYDVFAATLLQKSREEGLAASLEQGFVEGIKQDLEKIRLKSIDEDKVEKLTGLMEGLQKIEQKISEYHTR